jgi:hypothetical protein
MKSTAQWPPMLLAYNITKVRSNFQPLDVFDAVSGLVGPGEEVLLVREPSNPYDR